MKKKKMKTFIALVALTFAFGVQADSYLYWMVGDSVTLKDGASSSACSDFKSAAVGVLDNATGKNVGYLTLYGMNGESSGGATGAGKGVPYLAGIGSGYETGYKFYIELYNDEGKWVGRSEEMLDYNAASKFFEYFGTSTPVAKAWTPTIFTTAAVPEPSSALLMLLGCAGLALKRKKQAKA